MVAAGSGYEVQISLGKEPIVPIKGSCHCGNTQFEVNEAPSDVTRCTCSLCSKRGALWAYYTPAQFRLTSPPENVATYLWGSRTVKHHFCASCGCGTYSESPDWSTGKPDFDNPKIGVNARLFDDFDLDAVPVNVIDGKNLWRAPSPQHHPRRRVIAGAVLAADRLVDAGFGQARDEGRAEQEMIEPQARIARPTVSLVVPEGVDSLVRIEVTDRVAP